VSESGFRAVLVVLGVSQLAIAIWMVASPGSFFDAIAGFGERNDHYVRDVATFMFAIGVGLLIAARRASWRLPVLVIAGVWYLAHAVNHLFDIGDSDPGWVGPADFAALLATGLVLLLLAVLAARAEASATPSRGAPRP
jgi:peptidoglycan/LPS O-acetylase OafA/YrhL